MKILCSIYKTNNKDEMYLYVDKKEGLARVPETLLDHFGKPVHFSDLLLHKEKKLARARVGDVMQQIKEKGFFLQMPPAKEEYLLNLYQPERGLK